METMAIEPATIKTAMNKIGLKEWAEKLIAVIDEIEFERQMKISLEQADKGEFVDIDEMTSEIMKEL